ncbi:hypothetical protein GQ457_16G018900 [Hibiscus cannabinus]
MFIKELTILFTFDSLQSLHSNSREKGVEKNIHLFDIERVKPKKRKIDKREYPCDNGYKEVTVLPSRDIVYDQVKHRDLIPNRDFLPRQDPLSLFETSPLSSC